MEIKFEKLFQPIKIGPIELKNRVAVAPMINGMHDADGIVGMETLCHYTRRVRGGFGLIISEGLANSEFHVRYSYFGVPSLFKFTHLPGWRAVVEAVHAFGGRIIAQIAGGGAGRQQWDPERILLPVAASPVPLDIDPKSLAKNYDKSPAVMANLKGPIPREVTRAEIWSLIDANYNATKLAIIAGFDGVELHFANGLFGHNFLSPNHNKRTDEFGGSFENRTRYLRESFKQTIRAIKELGVEDKFIAGCRTNAAEHTAGGFTYEDTVKIHQMLIDLGSSFVDLSDGPGFEGWKYILPYEDMMSMKVEQAKFFDKHFDVPILIPSIHDPVLAEQVAGETENVIISLGRQALADPDWPNKVKEGRIKDVKRCLRCNLGCMVHGVISGVQVRCVVNPEQGKEKYNTANWPPLTAPGKYLR